MKLGLGTVQFGLDYGVSNPAGQTPPEEAAAILEVAQRSQIEVIDTASLYGTSEAVLGQALTPGHRFRVVTKSVRFHGRSLTEADAALLEDGFSRSLENLRCGSVYGFLVHDADDLLANNGDLLMAKMTQFKERGLVQKIGVSVYTSEQIAKVLDLFAIDLVQLPVNVLDQRLVRDGSLDRLKRSGVEIHARSAFLQGLLLMEPDKLPGYFEPVRGHLAAYRGMLKNRGWTPVQGALGFVAGLEQVDCVICGVNDRLQLEEICCGFEPLPQGSFEAFALTRDDILNPAKWRVSRMAPRNRLSS